MDKYDKIYIWHYITLAKLKLKLKELEGKSNVKIFK